jgi:hypothetical protein
MEEKIGFERWKKCKPALKTGWCRQDVMMVLVLSSLLFFPLSWIQAQDRYQDEKSVESVESKEQKAQQTKSGQLKRYEEVIHSGVRSMPGLFTVHRIDDRVCYEIPSSVLNQDMLWYTEAAKTPPNIGYGAQPVGDRIVRWERRGNNILLRDISYDKRAKESGAMQRAVELSSLAPIIMRFSILTEGKDKSAVIDVTPLLISDVPEFSAREVLKVLKINTPATLDLKRCFVEEVKSFPTNVDVRSIITYSLGPSPLGAEPPLAPIPGDLRSISIEVHYSMTLLPEVPMRPRFFDPRVGFFFKAYEEYASSENRAEIRKLITRYRLEKKEPAAPISEPIKPIVYYMSREVPEKWRPYIKKGVEDWNVTFEAIGFKNAILCRNAPTIEEGASWDPEDARYSVIRWVAFKLENAMGPHVHDPRSGEIISAKMVLWHDVLKLIEDWYFVQCGALDSRARKLPLPEEVIGEGLRYVVAHETGHQLGLRHNHKASSAYTVKELRTPGFVEKNGTTSSIMSYGRFNYVAQPEDGVKGLVPRIGPYDFFAMEWGYKPLPEAGSAEAERPILEQMAARQIENPWLQFGGEDGPALIDPTVKTEGIGSDSIEATALGVKNLCRVIGQLVPGTTKLGEDYMALKNMYEVVLDHWYRWMGSVVKIVGGVVETRTLGGRGPESFKRAPREEQRRAVQFLMNQAFVYPKCFFNSEIINQIVNFAVDERVLSRQKALMKDLLSGMRYRLLMDGEMMAPEKAYPLREFLADVQEGLFRELWSSRPTIDHQQRHLQRHYLEHIKSQLTGPEPVPIKTGYSWLDELAAIQSTSAKSSDFPALIRAALEELAERIGGTLQKVEDPATKAHLKDCLRGIDLILNPKN